MTTDPALLAQLQTAWHLTAAAIPTPTKKPPRCLQHNNPKDWLDEPATARPGWIRSTCRRCGAFVGYRPTN